MFQSAGAALLSVCFFVGTSVAVSSAREQQNPPAANSISGRVLDATSRLPIEDALVSVMPATGASTDTVRTDRDGRFVFYRVPAGKWAVGATASGYQGTAFSPGRAMLTLADGGSIGDVEVTLKAFGVIAGSVFGANGEPAVGLTVQPFRRVARGRYQASPATTTDDLGNFRFGSLRTGRYIIAVPSAPAPVGGGLFVYPTTYLPGVTRAEIAEVIEVDSGLARIDARLFLTPQQGVEVAGTLIGPQAAGLGGSTLSLRYDDDLATTSAESRSTRVDAQGRFSFAAVTPGRYNVSMTSTPPTADMDRPTVLVKHSVDVGDHDLTGLAVPVTHGVRISGRVVFDGQSPRPTAQQLRGAFLSMQPFGTGTTGYLPGRVREDGTFETVEVPPSEYYLFALPPEPWYLRSAIHRGRDITDSPLAVGTDPIEDVVVTLTDRPAVLVGTVRDARSAVGAAPVVAFPVDRNFWTDWRTNRRLRHTTADVTGVYRFTQLPAGEYFVTLLGSLEPDEWNDPEHLTRLAATASRVTLVEGATTTADLRLPGEDEVNNPNDEATSGPFVRDEREMHVAQVTTLRGVVRTAAGGRMPVAGAAVRLTRLSDGTSWSEYSDTAGQFAFSGVGHGRFRLTATKPAHLPAEFGTSTPGLPGRVLVVGDGTASTADLTMHRGGVITGVVRDHRGRPLPSAAVRVVQVTRRGHAVAVLGQEGQSASPTTDDLGVYRVYGLPPGDYIVSAIPELLTALAAGRTTMTSGADAPIMAHAPALHPAARGFEDARIIRLGAGEEAAGVDVNLALGRAAALSGAVVMPDGSVPKGQVSMSIASADTAGPIVTVLNGRFTIRAWTVGTYQLRVRATVGDRLYWASSQVQLGDDGATDVVVRLEPAPALSVRVTDPDGSLHPSGGLRVVLTPMPDGWRTATVTSAGVVGGAADVAGLFPGRYRVTLEGLPAGTVMRPMTFLDVGEASTPLAVDVQVTATPNRLGGRVVSTGGLDGIVPDVHVLAFSQDEAHWHADSDRVVVVAPDSLGHFVFEHLPAGTYVLVPVDGLATPHLADPSVLRGLVDASRTVVIADGVPLQHDVVVRR